ncbi:hypothetical protein CPB83DRAFT_864166 [Crepidotus variabilis]|uniref:Small secreted protein n=1 Tax=Crepidotus variabilis TaxID=179855 RepID=A0A9P6JIU5_9AGAR|nr:hypothetical protein CPB83DRAFT_864166 [Crepidotus variabilis]
MHFTQLLVTFVLSLLAFTSALPVKLQARAFQEQDYADFQISDGTGGDAKAKADAVFVTPFAGVNLATVTKAERDAVEAMRQAAEKAETDQFNEQIDAASGAAADALSVGKTKNKVLKLTGEVQRIQIDIAQAKASGDDLSSLQEQLTAEQTKLSTNIALDVKNKGKASKGVA